MACLFCLPIGLGDSVTPTITVVALVRVTTNYVIVSGCVISATSGRTRRQHTSAMDGLITPSVDAIRIPILKMFVVNIYVGTRRRIGKKFVVADTRTWRIRDQPLNDSAMRYTTRVGGPRNLQLKFFRDVVPTRHELTKVAIVGIGGANPEET